MRSASVSVAGASHTNLAQNPLYIDVFSDAKHVYTAGDLVHGVVRIAPTARPQNVSIVFKGISILYDKDLEGYKTEFFRLEQELFTASGTGENYEILRQGTAEDGKVELAFQFTFPHVAVQRPPPGRNWYYSKDSYGHPRFQHSPGFPLPPSCNTLMNVGMAVAPGVSYYLEARADSSMRIRQEVKFMPPAPEYDLSLLQPNLDFGNSLPKQQCRYKFIRTRKLLPDYREKKGNKLSKVKDFLVEKELFFGIETFSEIPFYRFNILATPPRVIVMGSDFPIHITLQHLDRSASIPEPPPLFLRRVRVQVISTYETFVPQPNNSVNRRVEHIDHAQRTITLVDKKFNTGECQPLLDGINLADIAELRISKTDERLIPSLSSYGMALEHEVQVEVWGECVKNEWSGIVCKDKVQLVSGWTFSHVPDDDAGSVLGHSLARPPPQAFPPPEYGTV
ncbi:uncharacterized protein M421DRAFT_423552 [Didymella exigua CBS 183.55]|uniref:Arrestin-like N-terminal domain-containing protein n=1 Tax=Didymella exigua CBS 183.55 TaxID=1150837 RepID=A0A6A5RE22_9PLEO|nr:uncharacterized protein M421DRAFT_423552 [Didymella exigua CBS 183.55]KAF1925713.1 hypothetical protein M421DRAFT_423552 [Didymella exigua CBS 183.55]